MKSLSCNQEMGDIERLLNPGTYQEPAQYQYVWTSSNILRAQSEHKEGLIIPLLELRHLSSPTPKGPSVLRT